MEWRQVKPRESIGECGLLDHFTHVCSQSFPYTIKSFNHPNALYLKDNLVSLCKSNVKQSRWPLIV